MKYGGEGTEGGAVICVGGGSCGDSGEVSERHCCRLPQVI